MAEGMPSLSNEILDNILSHSSKQVLRQTRLVSREMCAISTVYLFHHLHFDVTAETEEDVGSFRNILATKYLVSSVRELSFESPLVSEPQSHVSRSWCVRLKSYSGATI